MDKQTFLKKMEKAYEKKEVNWEASLLFNVLDFSFSYSEEDRTCTIRTEISELMLNPLGTVHGGIYPYIADTAMGHALNHFEEAPFVALELTSQFYQAISSGTLLATASFTKRGKKICFLACKVTDEQGNLLSETRGSFYRLPPKKEEGRVRD